jgi:hypothetical protein
MKSIIEQNYDRRQDLRSYLASLRPTHMMTINYKRPSVGCINEQDDYLRKSLQRWTVGILHRLYGHQFSKRNASNEFLYVAASQIGKSLGKRHLHLLIRCPFKKWLRFRKFAIREWPSSTDIKLDILWTRVDAQRAVWYCTRDLVKFPDSVILSNEFRRPAIRASQVV